MKRCKQSIIDNEEKVLRYLLDKERDNNNVVTLGTQRYTEIKGMSPEQFVQTLCALENLGYVSLNFAGPRSYASLCYVTLKEPGLTYFEDQLLDEENRRDDRRHDWHISLSTAIVSAIVTAIIGFLLGRLTG